MTYPGKKNSGNICARCSTIYGSCCVAAQWSDFHSTLVSGNEAKRIMNYMKKGGLFFSWEPNNESFIKFIISLFPEFSEDTLRAFNPDESHRSLGIDCFGRCSLLGGNGCLLPYDVRPLFCRIYPFWFIRGELKIFKNERCLALDVTTDPDKMIQLFRTSRSTLEIIYKKILLEWLSRE